MVRDFRPGKHEEWSERNQTLRHAGEKRPRDDNALRENPDDYSAIGGPDDQRVYGRARSDPGRPRKPVLEVSSARAVHLESIQHRPRFARPLRIAVLGRINTNEQRAPAVGSSHIARRLRFHDEGREIPGDDRPRGIL